MTSLSKNLFLQQFKVIASTFLYWFLFLLLLFLLSSQAGFLFSPKWKSFAYGLFGMLSAIVCTYFFCRLEKQSFKDIGLVWQAGTFFRFIKGFVLGSLLFIFILIILFTLIEIKIVTNPLKSSLLDMFWYLAIIPLALMEEIAFRSYAFLKLNKKFGLRTTQFIVCIAFALYHILQGWNVSIAFLGPAVWAWVFGLAAVWSGCIALPTGIHVALNIWQPLTGMKTGNYYAALLLDYPPVTTGKIMVAAEYAGVGIQIFVLVVAIILTEYYIRKRIGK